MKMQGNRINQNNQWL